MTPFLLFLYPSFISAADVAFFVELNMPVWHCAVARVGTGDADDALLAPETLENASRLMGKLRAEVAAHVFVVTCLVFVKDVYNGAMVFLAKQ